MSVFCIKNDYVCAAVGRECKIIGMKATLALFFKAHVGAYMRGGKMVNVNGYQGRQAHAVAGPGQMGLFDAGDVGRQESHTDSSNKSKIEPHKSEVSMEKLEAKIKGRDVLVNGEVMATIHGSRDPSGKNHQGYWIRTKDGRDIGWNEKSRKGMFAYAEDARRDALANPSDLFPPATRVKATDTPEFKEWFGSSKVVDDQGKPLVVYHATTGNFSEFKAGGNDPTLSGHAIWFTDSQSSQPANHNVGTKRDGSARDGHNVMPVYLSMKKPLIIDDRISAEWARSAFAGGSMEFPQLLPKKWVDSVRAGGEYDGIIYDAKALAKDYGWKELPENEYIVFDPTQIKSATGNNGKFDPGSADITKSLPVLFIAP